MGRICEVQFHTCYFNSKSDCTKVSGFGRIYTPASGRGARPRGAGEGRGQLEGAAQGCRVLGLGSDVLITDRGLCYAAGGED